MKLLLKILFSILAIFCTNISEAKTVLYSEVIGPALESGDELFQNGNYALAGIAFTYAVADIFTLGYASKYKIAAKGGTELFNL